MSVKMKKLRSRGRGRPQNIFLTVPPSRHMMFYKGQHVDLKKMAAFFNLSPKQMATVAGAEKNVNTFKSLQSSVVARNKAKKIANLCEVVAHNFGGDVEKTSLWFEMKNPMLGGFSPCDMLLFKKHELLQNLIFDAMTGQMP